MAELGWLNKTFATQKWTPEKRQYVMDQLDKGRIIPDIAMELNVAPGQLRSAMRYYGHIKSTPKVKKRRKKV